MFSVLIRKNASVSPRRVAIVPVEVLAHRRKHALLTAVWESDRHGRPTLSWKASQG